jgi:hypothetical protein
MQGVRDTRGKGCKGQAAQGARDTRGKGHNGAMGQSDSICPSDKLQLPKTLSYVFLMSSFVLKYILTKLFLLLVRGAGRIKFLTTKNSSCHKKTRKYKLFLHFFFNLVKSWRFYVARTELVHRSPC